MAAADVARSEKTIAMRQDQLRRETVQVLQATPRLADALRRWPSPPPPARSEPEAPPDTPEAPPPVPELSAPVEEVTPVAPEVEAPAQERAPKAAGLSLSQSRKTISQSSGAMQA